MKSLLRRGLLSLALAFSLVAVAIPPVSAAVVYVTSLKNSRLDAVTTAIGSNGKLKLYCADGTTIAVVLALSTTAAPAASGGTLTFNSIAAGTASSSCTVTTARFTTSADADVVTGLTVGTSGTNIVMNSNVLSSGQNVSITSASITHG